MSVITYYLEDPELTLERKTEGSVGYDLHAAIGDARIIEPGRRFVIRTGLHLAMPPGMEAQVRPRSGLVRDHGVQTSFGTIDSDYTGEVGVILINHGNDPYKVLPKDRVAQLVFSWVVLPGAAWHPLDDDGYRPFSPGLFRIKDKNDLPVTQRGSSGFGSTGR